MAESRKDGLNRRDFVRAAGLGAVSANLLSFGCLDASRELPDEAAATGSASGLTGGESSSDTSAIGAYGDWAAGIVEDPPLLSWRRDGWTDLESWRTMARSRLFDRIASPVAGSGLPEVSTFSTIEFDGLHIEELQWQLGYGPPTRAILLRPADHSGTLPGVLALHDHGGDKVFGCDKLVRTTANRHPKVEQTQKILYGDRAWANELAKRGYVVLVPDAFAFGSRRVRLEDIPEKLRDGLPTSDPVTLEEIDAYNKWAKQHEHVMARSLFSAGTTWPGVFLAEDMRALDVLCARPEVDAERIGCGGLSGGGLRTVYLGGADPRIKCAACVSMMTTWTDFVLNKSYTHTWMVYPPLLPRELDYPEILGLRVPLPTLVQYNNDDPLFTLSEVKRADAILRSVFSKADADDRYSGVFYDGPHKFDAPMQEDAFDWFDRWL